MAALSTPITEQDHTTGPDDAPVTLVEYGDYQCPSCGQAYPVVKRLQKHFGDKLRFVFRNFPLQQHPQAEPASEAAEFAAAQGGPDAFWKMHDALYERQDELSPELYEELAGELSLDPEALTQALEAHTYRKRVNADLHSGNASGVPGTPTFFINGHAYRGATDYDMLAEFITRHMEDRR